MNSHFSPVAVLLIRWTALLALAWAIYMLVRNRHPRWRLILWRSVLCFIVLMPFARFSIFKIPLRPTPSPNPIDRPIIRSVPATLASPARTPASSIATLARPVPSNVRLRIAASVPSAPVRQRVPWQALALSVWALGALWATGRLVRFQIILNRLWAHSQPAPETLQKRARDIAAGLNVSRRFAVQVSGATASPFAAGLFRPVVLLPRKLIDGLPEEEVTVLMAHEIAHFRRSDLFWCVAWRWLQALCWPHPLIWAIPAAHNLACEEEADRVASGSLRDSAEYSQLLARLALRVLDLPRLETDLAVNAASHIARRLDKLKKNPAKLWGWKHSAAGFALAGGLFLVTAACGFSSGEPDNADAGSQAAEPGDKVLAQASNQLALIENDPRQALEKLRAQASNQMAMGLFQRASSRAAAGRFQDAAADFEHGLQIYPSEHMLWFWATSLLIHNGDTDKYRANCKEMLRRFGDSTDGFVLQRVVDCCLWLPGALDSQDSAKAATLADKSVELTKEGGFSPWPRMTKGLADYRQGKFKSASETLDPLLKEMKKAEQAGEKTPSFDTCQADVCFMAAMAHRQLNEMAQARAAIDQGHEIVRTRFPDLDSGHLGGDWMNVLMTHALMSEADKTVGIAFQSKPQAQSSAGEKARTETGALITAADLSKMPHSYQFGDGDNLRVWQRIDDQTWHEVYPDGLASVFKVVGRAKVGQTEGTVVLKVAGHPGNIGNLNVGTLQAFIPDKGNAVMDHWFRFSPTDKWRDLAPMRDVDLKPQTSQATRTGLAVVYRVSELVNKSNLAAAQEELDKMIAHLNADSDEMRDALVQRAHVYAREGQWKEAGADLTQALEMDSSDAWDWSFRGSALAQAGDWAEYQKTSHEMLDRFRESKNNQAAGLAAATVLVLPDPDANDLEIAAKLADKIILPWWRQLFQSLAEYRLGHLTNAAEIIERDLTETASANRSDPSSPSCEANCYFVLAMIQHQLKHPEEARAAFARGREILETKMPKLDAPDLGFNWYNGVATQLLMKESRELIERHGDAAPAKR